MAKYQHIHKYMRDKLGKLVIYKCMLPGCSHYLYRNMALNKVSVCWYCGKEFLMSKKSLKLKKPHCKDCSGTPHKKAVIAETTTPVSSEAVSSFLNSLTEVTEE